MEERGLNSARGRVLFFFDGRKFEDSKCITFFCREKSNKKARGCVSPYVALVLARGVSLPGLPRPQLWLWSEVLEGIDCHLDSLLIKLNADS
jgi:hypothetical protein